MGSIRRHSGSACALVVAWLGGCAHHDPCVPMCAQAADAYGSCLDPDGAGAAPPDWGAAQYSDAQDFRDACETWAWEQRLIADAEDAPGRVDAACAGRAEALATAPEPCAAFTAMEWAAPLR